MGLNPALGMDFCPRSMYVILLCVGRGLATSWSPTQGVVPYVVKVVREPAVGSNVAQVHNWTVELCERKTKTL
jgi:hypothetical protein